MKRKMYRIELKRSHGIAQEMAVLAALSNGGTYISLSDIDAIARTELKRFPTLNDNLSVNLIGENNFTIDKGTENLLIITEVEIFELDKPELSAQEAKDILSGIPTIDSYANPQGLADNSNHELLN